MKERYTQEQIFRFINDAIKGRELDKDSAMAAADALIDYFSGIDIKKKLGLDRKRGQHGQILDTSKVYIDDPLFGIVVSYVAKQITYAQAKEKFKKQVGKGVGDRTIERYIADIKPRAESEYRLQLWLESVAVKKTE
ncbi:hypothetical protein N9H39_02065 [Gammaproteobacteria bacterium]|nr:hypothetical protein [Gammaproteobacteria bacterium]